MTRDEIRTRLEAVFTEVFDDGEVVFDEGLTRESVPTWDSLGHIRLMSGIEEAFGVHLSIDDMERMVSVRSIVERIAAGP